MLNRSTTGKKVTYADLMAEAKKLGADDVINVRIDQRSESSFSPLQIISGYTSTTTYYGTALAIKYKNVKAQQNIKSGSTSSLSGGDVLSGLSSLLPF